MIIKKDIFKQKSSSKLKPLNLLFELQSIRWQYNKWKGPIDLTT